MTTNHTNPPEETPAPNTPEPQTKPPTNPTQTDTCLTGPNPTGSNPRSFNPDGAKPSSSEPTGPDLRLAGPAISAWLTALILLGANAITAYATAVISLTTAAALFARAAYRRRTARPAAQPQNAHPTSHPRHQGTADRANAQRMAVMAVLICAAASAAGVALRLTAVASGPVRALAVRGQSASLEAVVTGDPTAKVKEGATRHSETVLLPARVEVVDRRRVRVPVLVIAAEPAWKSLLPSQRIRFTARLIPPRHGELLAAVALVRGPPLHIGTPSLIQRSADTIRSRLRTAASGLPQDERGVLPGLVDGDTSQVTPDLADAFEKAGLTHLMAVSGENLSLIIGAVLFLGRFTGLGRRAGPLLAGGAILGFVIVARPSPSVLRATVMGAVALAAVVGGRERQGVPALFAAALVLVLIDPELARSYGFALSALATAGILIVAPVWRRGLSRRMPRRLAEPLAVAAAAQVACAPLLAMLGTGVGLAAIPANLLAAPAVGPATLLGVIAAAVAPLSLPAARLVVLPAGLAVGWITGVARFFARAPYAALRWPAGLTGALLLAAVITAGAYALRRRRPRRVIAAALAGVTLIVIGLRVVAPGWPPRGWRFVTCDVGQGDGLALYAGPRAAVVVDTGPDPRSIDRCLRDLGVSTVPLLVLTHPHADHIDGVPGVLRSRTVGAVVISPDSDGEERRLLPRSAVRTAQVGDVWTIGPLTLTVLGPLGTEHVTAQDPGTPVNNVSVVLLARWPGLSALLPGDVELEAQRELVDAGVPTVDVLKVPHHGSKSQDPDFLAAVHATVAVTSVGAHNDYGHPAPATMAALTGLGERTYRTDRDGDIAIKGSAGGPTVFTRH